MRIFLMGILTILASSLFTNCEGQTKLPTDLPPNTEIIYVSEGGFAPSFFSAVISGGKIKIIDRPTAAYGEEEISETDLSDEEVKHLYKILVENKFDLIRPNKDVDVADGKSRSIELKFDGKRFYAVIGDGIKTTEKNGERFRNIEDALGDLVRKYGKQTN